MRNPLNSISMGTRLLKDSISPDKLATIMRMERSVQRMELLIENTLDFSRAHLARQGNSDRHGARDSGVACIIKGDERQLRIKICNAGTQIAPDIMRRLFQPFSRGGNRSGKNSLGLGLGLYIASEIAKAHGGTLTATSTAEAPSFVFDMPNRVQA